MTLIHPYFSIHDPAVSAEGGIDPLSLQPTYERLAERIFPFLTVRMRRPRFLTAMAGGWAHSLGLRADRPAVVWGSNESGECNVPSPNSGFVSVSRGRWYSIGLKADGSVVLWGGLVRMAWKGTLDGREVTTTWDGNSQSGPEASAGIYLLRAESEAGEAMGRLVRVDKLTSLGGVGDVTVPLPATQTNERGFP